MKDIKTINNEYNKKITNMIYDYCKKNEFVLNIVSIDSK
jgi:hypothetical protein